MKKINHEGGKYLEFVPGSLFIQFLLLNTNLYEMDICPSMIYMFCQYTKITINNLVLLEVCL